MRDKRRRDNRRRTERRGDDLLFIIERKITREEGTTRDKSRNSYRNVEGRVKPTGGSKKRCTPTRFSIGFRLRSFLTTMFITSESFCFCDERHRRNRRGIYYITAYACRTKTHSGLCGVHVSYVARFNVWTDPSKIQKSIENQTVREPISPPPYYNPFLCFIVMYVTDVFSVRFHRVH